MLQFIVRFLVARLSPSDLISLGNSLAIAGNAAAAKQAAINAALKQVNVAVASLTK